MLAAPDATEVDGFRELLRRFFLWIVFWVGLFYALSLTAIWWVPCLPPSTKPHENDRFWIVRNVIGAAHAILVTVLAVPACVALSGAPDDVRFASTPHLATCALDAGFPGGEYWSPHVEAVALAGLAFTAFTAADVVVSLLHGLATVDYMVHHGAFIVAGLVMRGNCVLPWKGSVQLCMEASTPFLSFLLLFQNRGKGCWLWVVISGIAFVVSYIYLRLLQNTYATVVLWLRRDTAMPARIPRWEVWFLLAAVTVGAAVQFFWFPAIARKVLRAVSGYQELRGGDAVGAGNGAAPVAVQPGGTHDWRGQEMALLSQGVPPGRLQHVAGRTDGVAPHGPGHQLGAAGVRQALPAVGVPLGTRRY